MPQPFNAAAAGRTTPLFVPPPCRNVNGRVMGMVKKHDNLMQVVVRNTGHMVPHDNPYYGQVRAGVRAGRQQWHGSIQKRCRCTDLMQRWQQHQHQRQQTVSLCAGNHTYHTPIPCRAPWLPCRSCWSGGWRRRCGASSTSGSSGRRMRRSACANGARTRGSRLGRSSPSRTTRLLAPGREQASCSSAAGCWKRGGRARLLQVTQQPGGVHQMAGGPRALDSRENLSWLWQGSEEKPWGLLCCGWD